MDYVNSWIESGVVVSALRIDAAPDEALHVDGFGKVPDLDNKDAEGLGV